jgi:hypothetical protein
MENLPYIKTTQNALPTNEKKKKKKRKKKKKKKERNKCVISIKSLIGELEVTCAIPLNFLYSLVFIRPN